MRAATRIAFLPPLAAIALSSAACGPAKADQPATRPQADKAPITEATEAPAKASDPTAARASGSGIKLREIDWANASVPIPASTGCPAGPVKFNKGEAKVKGFRYWITGKLRPSYGDLTGDGLEEAVVPLNCGNGGDGTDHLVVIASSGNRLRAITSISAQHLVYFTSHTVKDGKLVATLKQAPIVPDGASQTRTYQLRKGALVQVSGPTEFEWGHDDVDATTYDWSTATLKIPFKGGRTTVQPNDQSCPRVTVTFTHVRDGEGAVQAKECEYWVKRVGTADLDKDGALDSLVKITATRMNSGALTTGAEWYFAYGFRNGKPVLLGYVTAAGLDNRDDETLPDITATSVSAAKGSVRVTQVFRTPGKPNQSLARTFTWNGTRFVANRPAPNPRADIAP